MALWDVGRSMFLNLKKGALFITDTQAEQALRILMLSIVPEIHHVGRDKYYRGLDDIPTEYEQTHAEEVKLVTIEAVIATIEPDLYYHRRHAMLVGPPGCGKSILLEKVIDKMAEEITRYMVFPIDLQNYTGEEVMSATEFLFHRRGEADLSMFGGKFASMAARSDRLIFLLNGLDQMPAEYEKDCEKITEGATAPTCVIVHNLLIGKIYPNSKIISTCRHYRVKNFTGDLAPDEIFNVGELHEDNSAIMSEIIYGKSLAKQVTDIYKYQSPSICVLNNTGPYLLYNLLSAGNGLPYRYERNLAMILLEILIASLKKSDVVQNQRTAEIIQKMKELAYFGMKGHKYSFDERFVRREFGLTAQEIESITCVIPANYGARYRPMIVEKSIVTFVDLHMQEFMCGMKISDMPMEEYKGFLNDDIHKPKYQTLRRMVCSLILDMNVQRPAARERFIKVTDDMEIRRSLLLASMRAEYFKVKRRDLLIFLHAVRDCGDGGLDILPRKIDTIDLSHIQLFLSDTQAIGASIAGNVRIGCLNLSNCNISINGISILRSKIRRTKARIERLILDFCGDWTQNMIGIESFVEIIKACEIKELSLNNVIFYASGLQMLDVGLGTAKIKTLRFENVTGFTDQAYAILGDFIIRHGVDDLYITAKGITEKQKRKLCSGLREFKVKESMPMATRTIHVGSLDIDSD